MNTVHLLGLKKTCLLFRFLILTLSLESEIMRKSSALQIISSITEIADNETKCSLYVRGVVFLLSLWFKLNNSST